jgi:UDP-GlcNAc:undecaprenyl-phosphate GlcNAc-1-phosphate transferase
MYLTQSNYYLIPLVITIIIFNYVLINIFLKKLKIKKLIDFPDAERKVHKEPVQKIGGLVLIINIIIFFFLKYLTIELSLLILLISIFVIGFADDLLDLNPYLRLFLLFFCLYCYLLINKSLVLHEIYFETFNILKNLSFFSILVTILSILLLINAFNLFDGINGLSLTYFLIIFIYLLFKFNEYQLIIIIFICFVLLYFNLINKVFLGDSGVYLLSTILGLKLIEIHNNNQFLFSSENIFILLMIPGIDMFRLFCERIINKKLFYMPDKKHLHHYFLNEFGEIKTVFYLVIFLVTPIIIYEMNLLSTYLIILLNTTVYSIMIIYLKKNDKN